MKVVAIGGGEIGRPGTKVETLKIDKEIIALSGKKNPKVLFIPTASHDSLGYVEVVKKHFGKRLGCTVDVLLLWGGKTTKKEAEQKILSADIVYVGGGNTLAMLKLWKRLGLDAVFKEAAGKGIVLSGLSAGALCWFRYGHSDSLKLKDVRADYAKIRGLNFFPLFVCPHFDVEKRRQSSLRAMLKDTNQFALALDNCTALEIVDATYRIISSKKGSFAYLCYWKGKRYMKEPLGSGKKFLPLSALRPVGN